MTSGNVGLDKDLEILFSRSKAVRFIRNFFEARDFTEITTPLLDPELLDDKNSISAISSANQKLYFLPQSPQFYKEWLIGKGLNKYFQIAPCFRSKRGALSHRSLEEFYQIDIELAGKDIDAVIKLVEELVTKTFKIFSDNNLEVPFPTISYNDSLILCGTDKPFLKKGLRKIPIFIKNSSVNPAQRVQINLFKSSSLLMPQLEEWVQNQLTSFCQKIPTECTSDFYVCRQITLKVDQLKKLISASLVELNKKGLKCSSINEKNFFLIQPVQTAEKSEIFLSNYNKNLKNYSHLPDICWVIDFPLFKMDCVGNLLFNHNYSATSVNYENEMKSPQMNILNFKSSQVDLVINGFEVGGGAERQTSYSKFKSLLEVGRNRGLIDTPPERYMKLLKNGVPPHSGIALGLERLLMQVFNMPDIQKLTFQGYLD